MEKVKPAKAEKQATPKYDASLTKALHKTFFARWWAAGFLKLGGGAHLSSHVFFCKNLVLTCPPIPDTLKTTTPLLNKVLLTWLAESYFYHRLPPTAAAAAGLKKPRGIGYGIGLAVGLFSMQRVYHEFLPLHFE
jgi:hypothetical protein